MGLEARQYLRRRDVLEELTNFTRREAQGQVDSALAELRQPEPRLSKAVAHASAAQTYDQLLAQLQLYLSEERA